MTVTNQNRIRALTKKMQAAFAEEQHGLFHQLADERRPLLKSLDHGAALSHEVRQLLQEIATQDQTWLDMARRKKDVVQNKIDRLRGRQSAQQHLARAYSKTRPPASLFSRRG